MKSTVMAGLAAELKLCQSYVRAGPKQRLRVNRYAHALEVECISKVKTHKCHEFDMKMEVVVTNRNNLVVGGLVFPGNAYDVHTSAIQLNQVERTTGKKPEEVFLDRRRHGHGVFIQKRLLKRRQAVAQVFGNTKNEGMLGRDYLEDTKGNQMNAMLSCFSHDRHIILKKLRYFLRRFPIVVDCLLRAGKTNVVSRLLETPSICLKTT